MLSVLFLCYSYTIAPGVKGKGKAGRIVGRKIEVLEVEKGMINEKIKVADEKNLKIIVKMAKMYEIEYLFRRNITKLKKGNEISTLPCYDYLSESIFSVDTNSKMSSILQSREVHNLASTFKSTNLT